MHEHQVAAVPDGIARILRRQRQARMMATTAAWIMAIAAIVAVPALPTTASNVDDAAAPTSQNAPPPFIAKVHAADYTAARLMRDHLAFPWMTNGSSRENAGDRLLSRGDGTRLPVSRARGGEIFLPLKLTDEQRRVSRFVAGRYRIKPENAQRYVAYAFRSADEYELDPYLVLAVMSIESGFDAQARSSAGAQGLMQVLTQVHQDKFKAFGGVAAAFDPVANIAVGARILKDYLVREGSVEGALKSYVGAALLSHDYGYGRKVLAERKRIATAARGIPALRAAAGRHDGVLRLAMFERSTVVASAAEAHGDGQPSRID